MTSNACPCLDVAPATASEASGSPSRCCSSKRSAQECTWKGWWEGTALSHAPAYGCDTATSRTASLVETAASRCHSASHLPW